MHDNLFFYISISATKAHSFFLFTSRVVLRSETRLIRQSRIRGVRIRNCFVAIEPNFAAFALQWLERRPPLRQHVAPVAPIVPVVPVAPVVPVIPAFQNGQNHQNDQNDIAPIAHSAQAAPPKQRRASIVGAEIYSKLMVESKNLASTI